MRGNGWQGNAGGERVRQRNGWQGNAGREKEGQGNWGFALMLPDDCWEGIEWEDWSLIVGCRGFGELICEGWGPRISRMGTDGF